MSCAKREDCILVVDLVDAKAASCEFGDLCVARYAVFLESR